MDTISAGWAIGFAHYRYDQRVIGLQDTGGLHLQWGDDALVAQLIPMITHRDGFGDVLAQGTRAMEQRFGVPGLAGSGQWPRAWYARSPRDLRYGARLSHFTSRGLPQQECLLHNCGRSLFSRNRRRTH
jgi:aldehyde:ferredoxin oxidoreductase